MTLYGALGKNDNLSDLSDKSAARANLGVNQEQFSGNHKYVDSGHANATDDIAHGARDNPYATLDFAVGQCTASNGDVIWVLPGHEETLVGDSTGGVGVDIDVIGVSVVGVGQGDARPTFTFDTATAADFKIAADDVLVHNLRFVAGIVSQAMFIETSGDDCEVSFCSFENGSSFEALIAVNIGVGSNDSDRFYIHDCKFVSDTAGSTSAISVTTIQADVRIEYNDIRGDYSDAGIQSAVVHTNIMVKNNFVQNDNTGEHAIQFSAAGTGYIADNKLITDVVATSLDKGSCKTHNNLFWDSGNDAVDGEFVNISGAVHASLGLNSYDPVFGYYLTTADVAMPDTTTLDLFTVAGGKVMLTMMIGTIGTVHGGGSDNCSLEFNPSSGTLTILNTTVDIDGSDAGTVLLGDMSGGALIEVDALKAASTSGGYSIVDTGAVEVRQSATVSGTYVWQIWWKPIDEGATVTVT